jgi:4-hydroxy-3-polyprenylbenzoate decarboxylase
MPDDLPVFEDLRDFLAYLDHRGELARSRHPVSMALEVTEIHRRLIRRRGPALILENARMPDGAAASLPVLLNPFGTRRRAAWAMGVEEEELNTLGETLAWLRQPRLPRDLTEARDHTPLLRRVLAARPRIVRRAPCQETVREAASASLDELPIQICWPGEPAPLITWPLVITRPPEAAADDPSAYNIGVYRMQKLGPRRAIIRWLAHRGGAAHHRAWQALGRDMPVAIAIGADPATIMAAVTPVPETLGEYLYAGLLRRRRGRLVPAVSQPLLVPATAEIVLEGLVSASETAPEGPYGDHTGYYNAAEPFPVFRLTAITMRRDPFYLTTYTGRPPDEPAVIAEAMNEVLIPLLRQQFPELLDFWLPPEACSYRIGVARIRKHHPGQARRLMLGLWSFLPQFSYTKILIVVDEDIDARSWPDVMWALSTRFDASRDVLIIPDTPIDYLDFASPREGLGGKLGLDATTKIGSETDREWGRVLRMDPQVEKKIESVWRDLGIDD